MFVCVYIYIYLIDFIYFYIYIYILNKTFRQKKKVLFKYILF